MALLVATSFAALLMAGQALASRGRVLELTFGGAASTTPDPYPLSQTTTCQDGNSFCQTWIAVDTTLGRPSSGDVYVGDPNNRRVEKFSPSGSFILMFGKDVNKTKAEEAGASEAERDVCTAASGNTCQQGTEGTGPGAFDSETLALAVDSSTGPSAGDVYVANTTKHAGQGPGEGSGEGVITKFNESGEVISSWGSGGQLHSAGQQFGASNGITVDASSGNLWIYGTTEQEEGSGGARHSRSEALVFELGEAGSLITSWQSIAQADPGGIALDAEGHLDLGLLTAVAPFEQSNGNPFRELPKPAVYPVSDPGRHLIDVLTGDIFPSTEIASFESSCLLPLAPLNSCSPVETFSVNRPHDWGPFAVNYRVPADTFYISERKREIAAESIATVPDVTTLPPAPVSTSLATLRGEVDPEGVRVTQCVFQWGEGAGAYEHETPCEAPGAGEGNGFVTVGAEIPVQAGKAYHYRLVAANAKDEAEAVDGEDVLLGPPRIDSVSSTQVTSSSATLEAEINPRNLSTRYWFEYLPEAAYRANGDSFGGSETARSLPLVPAELAAGQKTLSVSAHVTGLAVHQAYRYRLAAENLLGEGTHASESSADFLLTWNTGVFSLLDGREWEMVSPPEKRGGLVEPIGEDWIIQAAGAGGKLAYVTRGASEASPTGYLLYQSSLATRTSGGWKSHNLGLPHTQPSELSVGEGWEYRLFSEDLTHAIVQPFGPFIPCVAESGVAQPCLSPKATEQTAFLASNYKAGQATELCSEGCYEPLVTSAEGVANVPPETAFGQMNVFKDATCPTNVFCGPTFLQGTPDFSHVVLDSYAALTPSSAAKVGVPHKSLYEWSAAAPPSEQLRLLSVLPGNSAKEAPPAQEEPTVGVTPGSTRDSLSADGSRFVFSSGGHVYLRVHATEPQSPIGPGGECLIAADACTIEVDAGLAGDAQFQTANSEVTRIFFTQGVGLAVDLYEYNLARHERVRMTTGANVVGSVMGASEDGSRIYFVANRATGQCHDDGEATEQRTGCGLYELHYDGTHWEAPMLIAVLSFHDTSDFTSTYSKLTARVSPDGQWLAFMSQSPLTGYDNQDAVSDQPDAEVYEYDASTGTLTCASCNPTGARPHGLSGEQTDTGEGGIVGGKEVFASGGSSNRLVWHWTAANLPGWTPSLASAQGPVAIYQSRYLSDSGRLFFDSADALVAKDTNGTEDVYEYEPEGVPAGEHACSPASEDGSITFKPARSLQVEGVEVHEGAGCVGLISSGESARESGFLDASQSGSEVFFLTAAKLSPHDVDTSYDVYDARECTSASPCLGEASVAPPPCEEEASCKPAPSPPLGIYGPSGSATFSGPGNLIAALPAPPTSTPKPLTRAQLLVRALRLCHKDRARKKRARCETQARRRYGAKKASRAGRGRIGR